MGERSIAFEIEIPPEGRQSGKTVRAIGTDPQFPRGAVIAPADGDVIAPRGNDIVRTGDMVLLVARGTDVAATIDFFAEGQVGTAAACRSSGQLLHEQLYLAGNTSRRNGPDCLID